MDIYLGRKYQTQKLLQSTEFPQAQIDSKKCTFQHLICFEKDDKYVSKARNSFAFLAFKYVGIYRPIRIKYDYLYLYIKNH